MHKNKIGLLTINISLFLVSVFIPYVSPIPAPAVTQPLALFFAFTFILMSNNKSIIIFLLLLMVPPLVVFVNSIGSLTELTTIRSLVGYLSLLCIAYAAYLIFRDNLIDRIHLLEKILKFVVWVWFIFGTIQFITGIDFTEFFKYSIGFEISSNRGVTSLATEPSYYGTVCVFLYIFMYVINRIDKFYKLLLIFQIIIYAQSPISILYIFIYKFLKFIFDLNFKKKIFFLFNLSTTILLLIASIDLFTNSRIGYLFYKIIDNPGNLLLVDQSLNHRFQHIFFSLLGSYENYFLPQNITHWGSFYDIKASEFSELVIWNPNTPTRIMSGYGSVLFELGLFGLTIPICVYLACKNFFLTKKKILTYTIFFNIIMFSAIPVAFPIFGFIIGFFSSSTEEKFNNN